ncbi:MAG: ATPase, partial [Candidatus Firestonebacteria bacterium]|nr:ATPase [Candidatus Firestonebacteria bacterium]
EVDIIYESAGKLYPVEIKLTATPKKGLFSSLEKHATQEKIILGRKKIICTSQYNLPIDKETDIVSALAIG